MKHIKVLHFSKFFPPAVGGIEQVAYDIVDGINQSKIGYHCDVICFNHKLGQGTIVDKECDGHIYRIKTKKVIASAPLSFDILVKYFKIVNKYDIIHLHVPNPLATIAALFTCKKKIVVHWHSDIVKQRKALFFFRPFQNWMLSKADKIIVTSDKYGNESEQLKNYRHKLVTVPIGIKDPVGFEAALDLYDLKNRYKGKRVVFSLGRLAYYKGFDYLIESAQLLPDDYIVLIGGAGEHYNKLSKKIQHLNLKNKVILLGKLPAEHLMTYYQLADVFCMPSIEKSEAFGVVQLEAMANSVPVVSTQITGSGVDWVNKHGISGLTVPVKDSGALAEAIIDICGTADKHDFFSKGARARFMEHFTAKKMCDGVKILYDSFNIKEKI
ncbi:glycosyltransferase [Enterobacteriaceae bacterium YMB-R22]|uniref:glycosyltransferase n=1 Tax=Tenebrionicola larvae TaxID=2815733 RepID=UPI00201316A5|nr:glycosyltransferase [Tenebrionicola larvae]MBV4412038.1 glycosyltransferase [Tenebrionicola larvae]